MSLFDDKTAKRRKGSANQPQPVVQGSAQSETFEETAVSTISDDPLAAVALTKQDLEPLPKEPEPFVAPVEEVDPLPELATSSTRVRVIRNGKVLLGACNHTFKAGNIIDANHYEAHIFRAILSAIRTEPV